MIPIFFYAIIALTVVGSLAYLTFLVLSQRRRYTENVQTDRARSDFHPQRDLVEARFVSLAEASGRPRGLRWAHVDFADDVFFARDRRTGQLRALVGVTIGFEAVEGGEMEDVEAVRNLRAGTAVFLFEDGRWNTQGRAIFNLEPIEAIRHFHHELEPVE